MVGALSIQKSRVAAVTHFKNLLKNSAARHGCRRMNYKAEYSFKRFRKSGPVQRWAGNNKLNNFP
jgi:hypothetical protein